MPITNGVIQSQVIPLIFELKKNGYEISVLETTGRFDSQENYRSKLEKKLDDFGIKLWKINVPRRTFLPSIMKFTYKTLCVVREILKDKKNGKILIYARNYKFSPALVWINFFWKIPFIYSPRGAYVGEREFYRKFKDILYASLIGFFEKAVLKRSATAIFETEEFREYTTKNYKIKSSNFSVIPNYYDESIIPPSNWDRDEMRKKLGFSGKKVIVYAGTVEVWYEFEKMFSLVSQLKKKDSQIYFQLFLKEDYARDESQGIVGNLREMADKFGLSEKKDFGISFYPPMKRYYYLSACDAGICLTIPQEFKAIMLYIKIVDYLGSNLPIIVNKEVQSVTKIIKESRGGAIIDYDNWEETINKIDTKKLFENKTGNPGIFKKFSSGNILPIYAKLFRNLFDSI